MALDFKSIANKKPTEIEKVPLPPVGTYEWQIMKVPDIRDVKSDKGEWEAVEFSVRAVAPMDNVDMSDYKGKLDSIMNRVSFMFDKNDEVNFQKTENRLKKFLQEHVKCWDDDMSLSEGLNAAVGGHFLGDLTWAPDKNSPGDFNANIGKTAPLD